MSTDRERGVILRRLDPDVLSARALAHLQVIEPGFTGARLDQEYAVARKDDDVYVVCTEGVGWQVDFGKPLSLNVIPEWEDEHGKHSGMTATSQCYLHRHEVVTMADDESSTDIDLADLVRSFGSRLESNFWGWHRRLR